MRSLSLVASFACLLLFSQVTFAQVAGVPLANVWAGKKFPAFNTPQLSKLLEAYDLAHKNLTVAIQQNNGRAPALRKDIVHLANTVRDLFVHSYGRQGGHYSHIHSDRRDTIIIVFRRVTQEIAPNLAKVKTVMEVHIHIQLVANGAKATVKFFPAP